MRAWMRMAVGCLMLGSCTAPSSGDMAMPPLHAPNSASMPPGAAASATFATELAGPATFLPPLPSAVVILRPDDMARNRAFCQAAMRLPTVQQAEASSVVAPNLIRTRWLVQIADIPKEHAADCDFLVGTYDYARAARLVASVSTADGSFAGRGPFLLMIIPDRMGLRVAGLDGSGYADPDMAVFISGWSHALSRTVAQIDRTPDHPGVVRSVFDLVGAILATVTGGAGGLVKGVFSGL